MGLMDIFADPSKFDTLTMGEKILGSLITALMGMGTTFVVLILIWGFIALISRVIRTEEKVFRHEDAKAEAVIPAPKAAPAPAPAAAAPAGDDALIAVITAAIAAAQGSAVTSNLFIRKIIRIPGPDPVWSNTGRHEALDSRRV